MSYATNLNTYLNPTPETILRKGNYGLVGYEEATAHASNVAPYPGMLIQLNSDGTVSVQTQRGANVPRLIAVENALVGATINDQYAQGDIVRYLIGRPGMVVQMPIPAGFSLTCGDLVVSYGDGSVISTTSGGNGDSLLTTVANSNTVTNTTAETSFGQTLVIPAKTIAAGDVLKIVASGVAPSTNSTDTLNVKLKIGSTVIAATGAVDVANNDTFVISATVVFRTVGTAGTLVAGGITGLGVAGTATARPFYVSETAVNTNANVTIDVTATWSVANTGNQVQMNLLDIERFRGKEPGQLGQAISNTNNSLGTGYEFADVMLF